MSTNTTMRGYRGPRPSRVVAALVTLATLVTLAQALVSCASVLGLERGELTGDGATGPGDAGGTGGDAASDGANAAAYAALVLADKPLAYYPFEEEAGAPTVANRVLLASPSERDGVVDGATLGAPGARGGTDRAMVAAGVGDRVALAWAGLPAGKTAFSIEVAVRPSAIDSATRVIASHPDSPDAGFSGYRLIAQGLAVAFERSAPGWTDGVRTESGLAKDRWTHVAVTFDGARLRLLVNGAIVADIRTMHALPGTGTMISVGSRGETELPLLGEIDELALYDREITPETIAAHAALISP